MTFAVACALKANYPSICPIPVVRNQNTWGWGAWGIRIAVIGHSRVNCDDPRKRNVAAQAAGESNKHHLSWVYLLLRKNAEEEELRWKYNDHFLKNQRTMGSNCARTVDAAHWTGTETRIAYDNLIHLACGRIQGTETPPRRHSDLFLFLLCSSFLSYISEVLHPQTGEILRLFSCLNKNTCVCSFFQPYRQLYICTPTSGSVMIFVVGIKLKWCQYRLSIRVLCVGYVGIDDKKCKISQAYFHKIRKQVDSNWYLICNAWCCFERKEN